MTKKALSKIMLFGISVIAITAFLIISVFYSYYERQTKNSLCDVVSLVESELEQTNDYGFINNSVNSQTRITLISPDGEVIADSVKDAASLENHSQRDEVKEAIEKGEGSAVRKSKTLGDNTYYYAKLLSNGNVLRASAKAQSVVSVLGDVSVYILLSILFVIICSVFVSVAITKSIVRPIEELGKSLDNLDDFKSYKELNPFVDALKEQNKKQKELDRQKKQFTANVSHELKTPLTSIAGYAELIETGIAQEPDIKPFAATIRKQALRLVNLSEDIIKLSQLEENEEKEIVFSSVDIYDISLRCVEALSINAKAKGVTIKLNGESTFIKANPSLLEELIYNLCDNAIRYNKENGAVNVSVNTDETGVMLCVEDTGIGIEEKYQERIFERFFRVDKSRSKATGGTGLGLAIVKHIAQIHGAELKIDSVLGKGTTISVHFEK